MLVWPECGHVAGPSTPSAREAPPCDPGGLRLSQLALLAQGAGAGRLGAGAWRREGGAVPRVSARLHLRAVRSLSVPGPGPAEGGRPQRLQAACGALTWLREKSASSARKKSGLRVAWPSPGAAVRGGGACGALRPSRSQPVLRSLHFRAPRRRPPPLMPRSACPASCAACWGPWSSVHEPKS